MGRDFTIFLHCSFNVYGSHTKSFQFSYGNLLLIFLVSLTKVSLILLILSYHQALFNCDFSILLLPHSLISALILTISFLFAYLMFKLYICFSFLKVEDKLFGFRSFFFCNLYYILYLYVFNNMNAVVRITLTTVLPIYVIFYFYLIETIPNFLYSLMYYLKVYWLIYK